MIHTADKNGNPGHPTKRFDMVRKLRKRGKMRIIGGGASGKPPVAVFLQKEFDYSKTVERKFFIVLDPGYRYIGFVVCEVKDGKLIIYCRGTLRTRIPDIKSLMNSRRAYRRFRRYLSRFKNKRLSVKHRRAMTKFKAPRYIRSREKLNATLKHGTETHLNLYRKLLKLFSLPASQTQLIMEDNVFNTRVMTWGQAFGEDYQESPYTPNEEKCLVCSTEDSLQEHHLIQRKKGGTEVKGNKIYLCESCHDDIHAGRIYLPIKGIQWRELGTMNVIIGMLRKIPWIKFIPASNTICERKRLNLSKSHANDALATAAAIYCGIKIDNSQERYLELAQFRRHNRARTHALRDRLYKLNGKIVARNRQKKADQKENSFADISLIPAEQKGLKVYPGKKIPKPFRENMPTIGGDVWLHLSTGQRFVATSVTSEKYIYSPALKEIVGGSYVHPDQCRRLLRNEGMVVLN
jgi:hypothetical protein